MTVNVISILYPPDIFTHFISILCIFFLGLLNDFLFYSIGKYNVERSNFTWYNNSIHVNPVKCKPCPSGGLCLSAHVVSRPNYWGYHGDTFIKFAHCPIGYCSPDPKSISSCAWDRVGTLCANCKSNHSLSLFSYTCVNNR